VVNSEITETIAATAPIKEVSDNTFSFTLQNVSYAIPHGLLPQPTSSMLELASVVEHDDVHSLGVEQTHPVD